MRHCHVATDGELGRACAAIQGGLEPITRWWPFIVAIACGLAVVGDSAAIPFDTELFATAGRVLLSDDWRETFKDPIIQAGVGELSFYAVTAELETLLGVRRFQLTSVLLHGGVIFGIAGLVALPYRRAGRSAPHLLLLAAGLLSVLFGLGSELYLTGHPAQFAILALWVLGAQQAQRGQGVVAGLLIAASTTFEPWGALGGPLLLLLPNRTEIVRAALWCAGGTFLAYGPFLLLGEFRMQEFAWEVRPGSILAPVLGAGSPFGWAPRLVQGALSLSVGAALSVRLRSSPHALWAAPLGIVTARLLVDPVAAGYYWSPTKILLLVAIASFLASRDRRGLLVLAFLYPVLLPTLLPQWVQAVSVLLGLLVLSRDDGTPRSLQVAEIRQASDVEPSVAGAPSA